MCLTPNLDIQIYCPSFAAQLKGSNGTGEGGEAQSAVAHKTRALENRGIVSS